MSSSRAVKPTAVRLPPSRPRRCVSAGRARPRRPSSSGRLADVAGDPSGRIEAHGLWAYQCREVVLDALHLGGADPLRPLIAELVKDRLALAEHVEAALGHHKALAAGITRVRVADDVPALLQDRDGFRGRLLGDRQAT